MKYLKYFEKKSIWVKINIDFIEGDIIYLNAFESIDDIDGEFIAKINVEDMNIFYYDDRAKYDSYAQDVLKKIIKKNITPEKSIKISTNKFNI